MTTGSEAPARTWGPFSGRQLTTIAVAVVLAAALVPGTVFAATTFSNVVVQDATSGVTAKVDNTGRLLVSGRANTTPSALGTLVRGGTGVGSSCTAIITPPAGQALVLTSVHVNVFANPSPGFGNNVLLYRDAACTLLIDDVNPGALGNTTLDYGTGVVIPAGGTLAAKRQGSVQAEVYAFGYTVAASQVPAAPASGSVGETVPQPGGNTGG